MSEMKNDRYWIALSDSVNEILSNEGRSAGVLSPETTINGDLDISSLDFVHLLLALEEKLGQSFPFETIAIRDGQYRSDLTLGELWDVMSKHVDPSGLSAMQPSATQSI